MGARADRAEANFLQGYNCAQSVFEAFADRYGIDRQTALLLSASFGGGMGRMREVCGAVSAAMMVIGLQTGTTQAKDTAQKAANYQAAQDFARVFKAHTGTILCRELLKLTADDLLKADPTPQPRTAEYYKTRPCAGFVRLAAELLEQAYGE